MAEPTECEARREDDSSDSGFKCSNVIQLDSPDVRNDIKLTNTPFPTLSFKYANPIKKTPPNPYRRKYPDAYQNSFSKPIQYTTKIPKTSQDFPSSTLDSLLYRQDSVQQSSQDSLQVATAYKTVAKKVRPVPAVFPEEARVIRKFPEDPLLSMPILSPNPPDFIPTEKLTKE